MDTDLEYADRAVAQMQRCLEAARADVARLVREAQEMAARVDEMRAERDQLRLLWDALNAERDVWLARADRAEVSVDAYADAAGKTREALGVPDALTTVEHVTAELNRLKAAVASAEVRADCAEAERDAWESVVKRGGPWPAPRSDAAKAARALPGGRDPGAKAYDPGPCASCRNPIEGHDYYRDRDPDDDGGENYHRDCWAWVKSNGTGPRPRRVKEEYKPSPAIALTAAEVHEALGWNVPAPAAKLPVVPATCGRCEHVARGMVGPTGKQDAGCSAHLGRPWVDADAAPPNWCPLLVSP